MNKFSKKTGNNYQHTMFFSGTNNELAKKENGGGLVHSSLKNIKYLGINLTKKAKSLQSNPKTTEETEEDSMW